MKALVSFPDMERHSNICIERFNKWNSKKIKKLSVEKGKCHLSLIIEHEKRVKH